MTEKVVLEIVTKTSASGAGTGGGESTGAGVSGKGSLGVLGVIGKLAIMGKLLTDMLYVFKPVLSVLGQIAKMIGQFLQPIAEVMIILLRPILILLRPVLMAFKIMLQPFMKLINRAGADMAQAAAAGNTGAVGALGGFVIGTIFKPLILILSNELGKVLLDAIGFLAKLLLGVLVVVVTAFLLPITGALDAVLDILKIIAKGILNLAKVLISAAPDWLIGSKTKSSMLSGIESMLNSQFMNDELYLTNKLLASAKNLIADTSAVIDTGISAWKDTMDTNLTYALDNLAITQSEKLVELENKFGLGLTTAVEQPIARLVTNLNNITAGLNQPTGRSRSGSITYKNDKPSYTPPSNSSNTSLLINLSNNVNTRDWVMNNLGQSPLITGGYGGGNGGGGGGAR